MSVLSELPLVAFIMACLKGSSKKARKKRIGPGTSSGGRCKINFISLPDIH